MHLCMRFPQSNAVYTVTDTVATHDSAALTISQYCLDTHPTFPSEGYKLSMCLALHRLRMRSRFRLCTCAFVAGAGVGVCAAFDPKHSEAYTLLFSTWGLNTITIAAIVAATTLDVSHRVVPDHGRR